MLWVSLLAALQARCFIWLLTPPTFVLRFAAGGTEFMPTYKAPVDDVQFLLNDVFHIERYANLPGFSDASPDVVDGDPRRGRQVLPRRC